MPRTGRPRSFQEDAVVAAARDLFWRRGYTRTSLNDLVDELGLLRGSLYAAFGDKHGLFLRALERYAADARDRSAPLLEDGPVLPRLRAMLLGIFADAAEAPGRGCLLGNTAAEALPADVAAADIVSHALRDLEDVIRRALAQGQATGEIDAAIDPGAHARMLVALTQGLHVTARAESDPHRLADAVDAALAPLAA